LTEEGKREQEAGARSHRISREKAGKKEPHRREVITKGSERSIKLQDITRGNCI